LPTMRIHQQLLPASVRIRKAGIQILTLWVDGEVVPQPVLSPGDAVFEFIKYDDGKARQFVTILDSQIADRLNGADHKIHQFRRAQSVGADL